jgi:hypothetical protein
MMRVFINYRDLGDHCAIKPESARKLIERQGWPKEKGNDGRMGAYVPADELAVRQAPILDRLRARIRHGKV